MAASMRFRTYLLNQARQNLAANDYGVAFSHYLLAVKLDLNTSDEIHEEFLACMRQWTELLDSTEQCDELSQAFTQAKAVCCSSDILMCALAEQALRLEKLNTAVSLGREARQRFPQSMVVSRTWENVCYAAVERWHFKMLNDVNRNRAYRDAIVDTIQKNAVASVLDIGCGTGLLSVFAEEGGAQRITLCDAAPAMMEICTSVLAGRRRQQTQSAATQLRVFDARSTSLSVPQHISERVDLVVTEIFDAALFGEHCLSTLSHAWACLLHNTPHRKGCVIPRAAQVYICAIECPEIRKENCVQASSLPMLELRGTHIRSGTCAATGGDGDPYTTEDLFSIRGSYRFLSPVQPLIAVDFNDPQELNRLSSHSHNLVLDMYAKGTVDALAVWFDLDLSAGVKVSTAPSDRCCWEQAIFPVTALQDADADACYLKVNCGDQLKVHCSLDDGCLRLSVQEVIALGYFLNGCHISAQRPPPTEGQQVGGQGRQPSHSQVTPPSSAAMEVGGHSVCEPSSTEQTGGHALCGSSDAADGVPGHVVSQLSSAGEEEDCVPGHVVSQLSSAGEEEEGAVGCEEPGCTEEVTSADNRETRQCTEEVTSADNHETRQCTEEVSAGNACEPLNVAEEIENLDPCQQCSSTDHFTEDTQSMGVSETQQRSQSCPRTAENRKTPHSGSTTEQSEERTWMDQNEERTWVDQSETRTWMDQSETRTWMDQSEERTWIDQSETRTWMDQSEERTWMDQSETRTWMDQSETRTWMDQSEERTWMDQSEERTWMDQSETRTWMDQSEKRTWMDQSEERTWMDQSEKRTWMDQSIHDTEMHCFDPTSVKESCVDAHCCCINGQTLARCSDGEHTGTTPSHALNSALCNAPSANSAALDGQQKPPCSTSQANSRLSSNCSGSNTRDRSLPLNGCWTGRCRSCEKPVHSQTEHGNSDEEFRTSSGALCMKTEGDSFPGGCRNQDVGIAECRTRNQNPTAPHSSSCDCTDSLLVGNNGGGSFPTKSPPPDGNDLPVQGARQDAAAAVLPRTFHLQREEVRQLNDRKFNSLRLSALRHAQSASDTPLSLMAVSTCPPLCGLQALRSGFRRAEFCYLGGSGSTEVEGLLDRLGPRSGVGPGRWRCWWGGRSVEDAVEEGDADVDVVCVDVVESAGCLRSGVVNELRALRWAVRREVVLVPQSLEVYAVVVDSDHLAGMSRLTSDDNTLGVSISPHINPFQTKTFLDLDIHALPHRAMSDVIHVFHLDLQSCLTAPVSATPPTPPTPTRAPVSHTTPASESSLHSVSSVVNTSDSTSSQPEDAGNGNSATVTSESSLHSAVNTGKSASVQLECSQSSAAKTVGAVFSQSTGPHPGEPVPASSESSLHSATDAVDAMSSRSKPGDGTEPASVGSEPSPPGPGNCAVNRHGVESVFSQSRQIRVTARGSGRATAVVFWFHQRLAPGVTASSLDPHMAWRQAAFLLGGERVGEGQEMVITAHLEDTYLHFSLHC